MDMAPLRNWLEVMPFALALAAVIAPFVCLPLRLIVEYPFKNVQKSCENVFNATTLNRGAADVRLL